MYALISYYAPNAKPMTPGEIIKMGAYPDFTDEQVHGVWPWDLEKYKEDDYYEVPLPFSKKGLYYINIYLSDRDISGSSGSTEGKIQASGVVIRVQ